MVRKVRLKEIDAEDSLAREVEETLGWNASDHNTIVKDTTALHNTNRTIWDDFLSRLNIFIDPIPDIDPVEYRSIVSQRQDGIRAEYSSIVAEIDSMANQCGSNRELIDMGRQLISSTNNTNETTLAQWFHDSNKDYVFDYRTSPKTIFCDEPVRSDSNTSNTTLETKVTAEHLWDLLERQSKVKKDLEKTRKLLWDQYDDTSSETEKTRIRREIRTNENELSDARGVVRDTREAIVNWKERSKGPTQETTFETPQMSSTPLTTKVFQIREPSEHSLHVGNRPDSNTPNPNSGQQTQTNASETQHMRC